VSEYASEDSVNEDLTDLIEALCPYVEVVEIEGYPGEYETFYCLEAIDHDSPHAGYWEGDW